jgi:D-alanine-D-alanine ligase-like ATP-grasp enzyme
MTERTTVRTRLLLIRRLAQMFRRFRTNPLDFADRRDRFYEAYWQHAAARIGACLETKGNGYYELARMGRSARVQYHHIDLDTYFSKTLADDKSYICGLLRELGFFAPSFREYTLRTVEAASSFLREVGGPCVVKPTSGSGGRGVTTGVDDEDRLIDATLASSNSLTLPTLMIEKQIPGDSYRLLYLDGRLLHAVRRGRCTVVGDGTTDIRGLVALENGSRLASERLDSLNQLTIDLEMKYTLADQGKMLTTVPDLGEHVVVKNVCNENARRDQTCVTERVHPDYGALAAAVSQALRAHLLGIDVMSEDISAAPQGTSTAVNEINIPPGLHYHELIEGVTGFSDVGPAILDYLL